MEANLISLLEASYRYKMFGVDIYRIMSRDIPFIKLYWLVMLNYFDVLKQEAAGVATAHTCFVCFFSLLICLAVLDTILSNKPQE